MLITFALYDRTDLHKFDKHLVASAPALAKERNEIVGHRLSSLVLLRPYLVKVLNYVSLLARSR